MGGMGVNGRIGIECEEKCEKQGDQDCKWMNQTFHVEPPDGVQSRD